MRGITKMLGVSRLSWMRQRGGGTGGIVLESIGTQTTGTDDTITTSAPSGVQVGDVLIFVAKHRDTVRTMNAPSGWNSVSYQANSFSSVRMRLMVRVADGTANDTPSIVMNGSTQWFAVILRFSGVDTSTPIHDSNGTWTNSGGTIDLQTVTTSVPNSFLLAVIANRLASVTGDPSGWIGPVTSSGGGSVYAYTKAAPTADTYGGETVTFGASQSGATITIALTPA